jgi:Replication-relaxation
MTTFEDILSKDRIMSLGQCQRHYGIDPGTLKKVHLIHSFLSKTNYSRSHERFAFVTLEPELTRFRGFRLRHLAGVTEMRHLLQAPQEHWQNHADKENALKVPDGIWQLGQQRIAIEFDTGSYSITQLKHKMFYFDTYYEQQIWGTPSLKRKGKLEALLLRFDYKGSVLLAEWW